MRALAVAVFMGLLAPVGAAFAQDATPPILYACDGFDRAVSERTLPDELRSTALFYARAEGGAPVTEAVRRWSSMTDGELLAEVTAQGDSSRCASFSAHLRKNMSEAERAALEDRPRGTAQIPVYPSDPCAALQTCCDAIPAQLADRQKTCKGLLGAMTTLDRERACRASLETYRADCTGG